MDSVDVKKIIIASAATVIAVFIIRALDVWLEKRAAQNGAQ